MIDGANLSDIDVMARTLWGEARGEGRGGMIAVAWVILNRLRDRRWPTSIMEVCKQPWQFSCWNGLIHPNHSDANFRAMELLTPRHESLDREWTGTFRDEAFVEAWAICFDILLERIEDPTGGSAHYFRKGTVVPSWAQGRTPAAVIGHHLFFNDVP